MNITHKSTYTLDMSEAEFLGLASFVLKNFDPDSNCTLDWAEVYDKIRESAQKLLDPAMVEESERDRGEIVSAFNHGEGWSYNHISCVPSEEIREKTTSERAKVGDVIQSNEDDQIRFIVGYVGSECAFESPQKILGKFMLKHGQYTIVKRAECAKTGDLISISRGCTCIPQCVRKEFEVKAHLDGKVWFMVDEDLKWLSDGNYTVVKRAGTEHEKAPEPSTSELVDMLVKRDGVNMVSLSNANGWSLDYNWSVSSLSSGGIRTTYLNDRMCGGGSARILVVKE